MENMANFPVEIQDDFRRARLPSLYSDFRQLKSVNPDGYAANLSAWTKALSVTARKGLLPSASGSNNLLVLRVDEQLGRSFDSSEWGRPLALPAVLDDGVSSRAFIPLTDFESTTSSIYDSSWSQTAWHIASWPLQRLGISRSFILGERRLTDDYLVIMTNLEQCSSSILQAIAPLQKSERMFSLEQFRSRFSNIVNQEHQLTNLDFQVLLKFLSRDKQAASYNDKVIKFADLGQPPEPVTEQDETVTALKTLIESLTAQIGSLLAKVDTHSEAARSAVAKGNRVAALSSLRSKKHVEQTISQRSGTLARVEEAYSKIEQASDQVQLMRMMEASSNVLKTLNARVGGVENVEKVVDGLGEQMEQTDEIGKVMNQDSAAENLESHEVNEELETLEQEQRNQEQQLASDETKKRLEGIDLKESERHAFETGHATSQREIEDSIVNFDHLSIQKNEPKESEKPQLEGRTS